jgi:hypothetical protein
MAGPVRHIGFAAAVEKARAGGARNPAAAIAAGAQKASPAAIARNPRLKRVHGAGSKYRKARPQTYMGNRGG